MRVEIQSWKEMWEEGREQDAMQAVLKRPPRQATERAEMMYACPKRPARARLWEAWMRERPAQGLDAAQSWGKLDGAPTMLKLDPEALCARVQVEMGFDALEDDDARADMMFEVDERVAEIIQDICQDVCGPDAPLRSVWFSRDRQGSGLYAYDDYIVAGSADVPALLELIEEAGIALLEQSAMASPTRLEDTLDGGATTLVLVFPLDGSQEHGWFVRRT